MIEIITAAVGATLGIIAKGAWDLWRASATRRAKQHEALSAAQIEDEARKRDLLVAAYNQMMQAERQWTTKEIEVERRCYVAEEKLARVTDEHKRELHGAQLLSEQQYAIIVQHEATIEIKEREISGLRSRLDGCTCGAAALERTKILDRD